MSDLSVERINEEEGSEMGRARQEVWMKYLRACERVCVCVITWCYCLWANTERDSSGINGK